MPPDRRVVAQKSSAAIIQMRTIAQVVRLIAWILTRADRKLFFTQVDKHQFGRGLSTTK